MKNSFLAFFCLVAAASLVFTSCKKDESKPIEVPAIEIPNGGTVSGVLYCCNYTEFNDFEMSDVSGRSTSNGGFSFKAINESYELLFYFPNVSDTGIYASSYDRSDYLKVIDNGDTTTMNHSPIIIHITHYDEFPGYALLSGTFEMHEIGETSFTINGGVENGVFTNIPIVHNADAGNYVIYRGDQIDYLASKVLITDHMYFSRFTFQDKYVESNKFKRNNSDFAWSTFTTYGIISSEINITQLNGSENLVSGNIKTREDDDLDLHFQDLEYMDFPTLEDGQVAVLFNYGEEILYFDSAKYAVNDISPNQVMITAYEGESTEIHISVFYNPTEPFPYQGQSLLNNSGLTYLENYLDGHTHIDFLGGTTKLNFEFARTMGSGIYRQLCIKGKHVRREM